jgi:hypothetical protein
LIARIFIGPEPTAKSGSGRWSIVYENGTGFAGSNLLVKLACADHSPRVHFV